MALAPALPRRPAQRVLNRPDGRGQRIEPAQVTPHLAGVAHASGGNRIVGGRLQPVQADLEEGPGAGMMTAAVIAGGQHSRTSSFGFGQHRPGGLGNLEYDPTRNGLTRVLASQQPEADQGRYAARLMILDLIGDGHDNEGLSLARLAHCNTVPAGCLGTKVLSSPGRSGRLLPRRRTNRPEPRTLAPKAPGLPR